MDDKAFSSIDFVSQCLLDNERSTSFDRAINSVTKADSVVLDVGTGSGIMALFSARAGAKKVYAIEYDPYVASAAQKNFNNNKEGKNIELVVADARCCNFKEGLHFDVVVMEMLTTGMVDEFQIQAINNLYEKNVVSNRTIFIPKRQETYVALTKIDHTRFGFKAVMVWHLWKWHNWKDVSIETMSNREVFSSIDFRGKTNEIVDVVVPLHVTAGGEVNSVCLFSRSILTDGEVLDDTESLNAPVIVPLDKTYNVTTNQIIKLRIQYRFGWGYKNFKTEII